MTNIIKGIFGKLPIRKQNSPFKKISWANEKILKHQEDKAEKEITLSGFNIYYKRPYELLHTYKEIFENEIYKFNASSGTPVIIDCGANIGLSVLYFKALYPAAVIIAFEPDENNFLVLKKNVEKNKLSTVTLFNSAVWIHNDSISFSSSGSEASHISAGINDKTSLVKAARLKEVLERHDKIDFLKIDIEGAEREVLTDCAKSLSMVQNLFLEYHGKTNETEKLKDIISIIEAAGFSTYIQNAADHLQKPFLNKTTNSIYDVQLNIFCFR